MKPDLKPLAERIVDRVELTAFLPLGIVAEVLDVLNDAPELLTLAQCLDAAKENTAFRERIRLLTSRNQSLFQSVADWMNEVDGHQNRRLEAEAERDSLKTENDSLRAAITDRQATLELLSGWLVSVGIDPLTTRLEFVRQMAAELRANAHKGDWRAWQPDTGVIEQKIDHRATKLCVALADGNAIQIRESAADLANLAMKADEIHGGDKPEKPRVNIRVEARDLLGGLQAAGSLLEKLLCCPHGVTRREFCVTCAFDRLKAAKPNRSMLHPNKSPAYGVPDWTVTTDAGRRAMNHESFMANKCVHGERVEIPFGVRLDMHPCDACRELYSLPEPHCAADPAGVKTARKIAACVESEGCKTIPGADADQLLRESEKLSPEVRARLLKRVMNELQRIREEKGEPPSNAHPGKPGVCIHRVLFTEDCADCRNTTDARHPASREVLPRSLPLQMDGLNRTRLWKTESVATGFVVTATQHTGKQDRSDTCTHVLRRDEICAVCEPDTFNRWSHTPSNVYSDVQTIVYPPKVIESGSLDES